MFEGCFGNALLRHAAPRHASPRHGVSCHALSLRTERAMAGWITFFKVIPWTEVIAAAPAVVKGAQKLWSKVKKQEAPRVQGPANAQQALEAQVAELRAELTAASELVTKLAEQNSRLFEAVEVLRVRTRVLFAATLLMAIGLVVNVAMQ